jgi:hypothetical protein
MVESKNEAAADESECKARIKNRRMGHCFAFRYYITALIST